MAKKPAAAAQAEAFDRTIGNVENLQCTLGDRPPEAGDLIFNAAFEGGNLGGVTRVSDFEYNLQIRPDMENPKQRLWFHFTVRNSTANQHAIFNITNFSKTRSLFRDGMSPLMRSKKRAHWERIQQQNVFYYRMPGSKKSYQLSMALVFDDPEDEYEFAYAYPYTYSHLQGYLKSLEDKRHPFLQRELLAESEQGRRLDLITIGPLVRSRLQSRHSKPSGMRRASQHQPSSSSPSASRASAGMTASTSTSANASASASGSASPRTSAPPHRICVFITARVHPGETAASYVCEGLIDFLCSTSPLAVRLRERIVFKIIPMLNPDGVYHGTYRSCLSGFDLNRCWNQPIEGRHPTIWAAKQCIAQESKDYDLDFFLDLHGHSSLMNTFMYGNEYEDMAKQDSLWAFPVIFANLAEDFSLEQTTFNNDKQKAGTGRRSLCTVLPDKAHVFTLESSMYGYCRDGETDVQLYDERAYRALGRNLGRAFAEFYLP